MNLAYPPLWLSFMEVFLFYFLVDFGNRPLKGTRQVFVTITPDYAVVPTLSYAHSKTDDSLYQFTNFTSDPAIQHWQNSSSQVANFTSDWIQNHALSEDIDESNRRKLVITFDYASKERLYNEPVNFCRLKFFESLVKS